CGQRRRGAALRVRSNAASVPGAVGQLHPGARAESPDLFEAGSELANAGRRAAMPLLPAATVDVLDPRAPSTTDAGGAARQGPGIGRSVRVVGWNSTAPSAA